MTARKAAHAVSVALCLAAWGGAASADVFGDNAARQEFRARTKVLDTRAASEYASSISLSAPSFSAPTKWGGHVYSGSYSGPYLDMAKSAADRHSIPEGLFLRLVQQESGWNPRAVSSRGALGLAQLMPATIRHFGIKGEDPYQNLDAGARYLAQQYRDFGSWPLALAAYNAGPQVVRRYGGIPPYAETQAYVAAIWGS